MNQISNVYLIKDLSRLSGYSVYTLKYYLKLELISESGRSPETRFRDFDNATLERLARIRALRKERKSLMEIQQLVDGSGLRAQGSGQLPPAPSPQPPAAFGA